MLFENNHYTFNCYIHFVDLCSSSHLCYAFAHTHTQKLSDKKNITHNPFAQVLSKFSGIFRTILEGERTAY